MRIAWKSILQNGKVSYPVSLSISNLSQLINNGNSTEWSPIRSVIIRVISNSNWTMWSTIQGVIARVIQNRTSAKRETDLKIRARLLPELYDTRSNY